MQQENGIGNYPQKRLDRVRNIGLSLAVTAMMLGSTKLFADVEGGQRGEVEHLLGFIQDSGCSMERNGSWHEPEEALRHIRKKYGYFRDKITTTEDFIELSASKSTMSSKYYLVSCGERTPIKARDWLLQELNRYRRDGRSVSVGNRLLESEVT